MDKVYLVKNHHMLIATCYMDKDGSVKLVNYER